ncbi:hypothetical protein BN946_scf184970.g45 [Trametes cinnabarina]|uniref:Carboxylesterase type B domain-containing protein n=1 Tax=Pycnoporus cinnabarinus TaxID=5643 RepID=A0A060SID5_PYCCI|nr:hypothetical protein BN946_scf184970.g45 [Trametes cinnabarina]
MLASTLCLLAVLVSAVLAAPLAPRAAPTVQLDQGTFIGATDGTLNKFLGIPFGKAPVGDLRFNLPVAVDPYNGTHTVTSFGPSCPQQAVNFNFPSQLEADAVNYIINSIYQIVFPAQEDCLNLNVIVPAGTKPNANLPVVARDWYAFIPGVTDRMTLIIAQLSASWPARKSKKPEWAISGCKIVSAQLTTPWKAVEIDIAYLTSPIERLALRWIQKYISAFGGDPTKVTMCMGRERGAISVALHLITNGGNSEGLFRGAFMQSGSPIPVGDITHGQADYDTLVSETGCSGAADTLQCLRQVPYDKLKKAVDASPGIFSPNSLRLTWLPRVDGKFLTDTPQNLVQQGSVANVPFVTGDCDDEGTLFSLSTLNITTEEELRSYVTSNYLPQAENKNVDQLFTLYPADITQGSPFDTGVLNALTPQYKRLAAMQGDLVFQAPRRYFLQHRSDKQSTWSFLSKRLKGLPDLGSAHATDILNIFGGGELADYLINFANNLDPNGNTVPSWPKYSASSPKLLTFTDDVVHPVTLTNDDYRVDAIDYITQLSLQFPI